MKKIMGIRQANFVIYVVGFIISASLIGLYFIKPCLPILIVFCSIGASGIGAVLLAYFIDLSNEFRNEKNKQELTRKIFSLLIFFFDEYINETKKCIEKIYSIIGKQKIDIDNYEELKNFVNDIILEYYLQENEKTVKLSNILLNLENILLQINKIISDIISNFIIIFQLDILDNKKIELLKTIGTEIDFVAMPPNYLLFRKDINEFLNLMRGGKK